MRIVLDTNILVSAFLSPRSKPARILRLVLQGDIEIVCSEAILAEYEEVLMRPKFKIDTASIYIVLDAIRSKGLTAPSLAKALNLPDKGDEPFLEAALAADADFLITGNTKHFPDEACKGHQILGPDEFLPRL